MEYSNKEQYYNQKGGYGGNQYQGSSSGYNYTNKNYKGSRYNSQRQTNWSSNSNYNNHNMMNGTKNYNKQMNQGSVYNPISPNNSENDKIDTYTAQMLIYRAEMFILMRYPYLIDINTKNENILSNINENSLFFVIKSFSEEDVHKAIKYNLWTSTKNGNQTLSNSFKLAKERGGDVYLFFSCNGSGRFVGLARMKSDVDYTKLFPYWTQDNKWGGLFNLEWIFIKDVVFNQFKNIVITLKDGETKSVTHSRDTQEVPFNEGKKMVEIVQNYMNTNTILEHFEYYDMRQENYEKNNPKLQEKIVNSAI